MLKLILFAISMVFVGYLIVTDGFMVSVSAFGYEVTLSIILLVVLVALFFYILHVGKKPFCWLFGFKERRDRKHLMKKEGFLTFSLQTVLDQNDSAIEKILHQKRNIFGKKDTEQLLLTAIFEPTPAIFEQLLQHPDTELAGIRGLFLEAQKKGDLTEASKLLNRAAQKYTAVSWLRQAQFDLQVLQNDWEEALKTIEDLKKRGLISKPDYLLKKSAILLCLDRPEEAFSLDPQNPATGLAYAQKNPSKAKDILMQSWKETPCWDTYLAFKKVIKEETPAKQIKWVEKLVSKNPTAKLSLLALADSAMGAEMWGLAKEHLDVYMQTYPLTEQAALMMAHVERAGWHHEATAKKWEEKAMEATEKSAVFICSNCNHTQRDWSAGCPVCNTFAGLRYTA